MADALPPNGSGDFTNGASDEQMSSGDLAGAGSQATEQTLADSAQTLSDADQTNSDLDQTSAEEDQLASDHDQAASDRDFTHGGDPELHRVTREMRARSTLRRGQSAEERVEAAAVRDAVAHARDLAALARDRTAALRDREVASRDAVTMGSESAEKLLRRVVAERIAAANSRAPAADDREQAARDRERASRDRAQGRADRDVLLSELTTAETDATGARNRNGACVNSRPKSIEPAERMARSLSPASPFRGLERDDAGERDVADALLRRVVHAVRGQLRASDLVVRLGPHELLCVLSGVTEAELRTRLATVQAALAARAISLVESTPASPPSAPHDTATDIVGRVGADVRPGQ